MSNNRKIYVVGLLILLALVVFALNSISTFEAKYTEVTQQSVIWQEDTGVIQFDITNREGAACYYAMDWYCDGQIFDSQVVLIADKQTFSNTYYINPQAVKKGKVYLLVRKESEPVPFEAYIYNLPF